MWQHASRETGQKNNDLLFPQCQVALSRIKNVHWKDVQIVQELRTVPWLAADFSLIP